MKIAFRLALCILLLLCLSQNLLAQANNQVLQAYVLQGKQLNQLEKELFSKAKVLVSASRDLLELSEQQVARLDLACRGDISRFMQDLTELDLHTKGFDMQKMAQNPNDMQRIWPIVMPARQQIEQGLHGESSLFQKTLDSTLTEEQQQKYKDHQQQKFHRKVVAVTKLTLVEMEKKMPLTKKQRDRIVELINESAKPRKFDDNMSYYLGVIVLSKLPKEKLSEILTEDQLKIFQQMTRGAQQFGGVEW